jgi:glutamate--cysteine ligase
MVSLEEMKRCFAPVMEPYRPRLGFEYEVQCLDGETLRPVPFDGPTGLARILQRAAQLTGGTLLAGPGEPHTKVSLPDGGLLSLEPGGQLEFSSAPEETFGAVLRQFQSFLDLLEQLRSAFCVHYFFGGVNPVHTVETIGLVTPTRRYQIMDRYFPGTGKMGRRMMRQTCSIQVSFDYRDAQEGEDLLRTAQYVAPFAAALFANAPYVDGGRSGYRSFRVPIWADTDPSRTGLLPGFTRQGYTFEDYLQHVVQAPMFFVQNGEQLVPAGGITFAEFNERGFDGRQASLVDFALHNSTIFTDVRLKHTVEVRTVDCQDPALFPAALAFLAGILFCRRSREASRDLLGAFTEETYRTLADRLARDGLSGELGGRPTAEIALELIELAAQGLPACFPDGRAAARHLDPIRELALKEQTPADVVLARFGEAPAAWLAAGRTFD